MAVRFFEDGFDYKKYIDERLLDVKDIEERQQLRNIVADMLIPFYEHVEESYKQIEKRLFSIKNEFQGKFQIITGIQPCNKIDVTDTSMFPMRTQDMEKAEILVEDLLNAMHQGRDYKIYSVFVQADYKQIKELEDFRRTFRAVLRTEYGEYPATVRLSKNHEYLDMIKELYQEFVNNGIPWKTVCAPYLHKIFDVQIIAAQCPEDERIEEITVSFEEFEPYVRYNYVPLWNIRDIEMKTSAYPTFCLDRIHYEHCIFGGKIKEDNDYLVAGKRQLWSVSRRDGDLYIQCDEKTAIDWVIREFCYEASMKQYELPLMKSEMNISKKYIRTIAEAKNYVKEMNCDSYIELKDINQNPHSQEDETYDCDEFFIDEIRKTNYAPVLYFEFVPTEKETILTRDMMSYVVSRFQLIYPEYCCKGILL